MDRNNYYLTDVIKEVDGLACSHPTSVNIDVANYYYSLAKMTRPLLVVEIGCFIGFSTLHFAQALREQGFGRMIAIDTFDSDVDAGLGLENRENVALRYREKANLKDIVTYVKGYSTEVYSTIENEIQDRIDLLYIDGDHTISGAFKDFNTYYNDVRVGGFVILHDIYPAMCSAYGPRALIDHLQSCRLVPKRMELIEMQTRDGFGIAVLRKTSSSFVQVRAPMISVPKSLFLRAMTKLKGRYTTLRKMNPLNIAQHVQIQVVDSVTQKPVPGALVICPQRCDEQRVTDNAGVVYLTHYLPNRYLFNIFADGYQGTTDVLVDVEPGKPLQEYTVLLEKNQ